jgi:hypothetical protein
MRGVRYKFVNFGVEKRDTQLEVRERFDTLVSHKVILKTVGPYSVRTVSS